MNRRTHRTLFSFGLVALLASVACGRPYQVATPDGFIDLGDRYDNGDENEYRASTADGVVLGVRAIENEPKADMKLAVRALENRVRLGQGYALVAKKDVTAQDGTKGVQLEFGHDEAGGPHVYIVTLFVTDDWVYVLEAGGKKDLVTRARPSIDWSVQNFRPD